ncbi:TonB family protein [Hymenobacter aquaticus]|uniref:TonB family protein n=1 Tax=Hymenobacter aquaticus TaxID=1867101 RepID=A0A4Z0Q475_9BACT|nr:energy transducer TonB [Hymenobacter aquaticus]TGE24286.1 TonB family protein [Hymenobacter aquaticus]
MLIYRGLFLVAAGLGSAATVSGQSAPPGLNAYFQSQGKNDDLSFGPGILFRTDTVRTAGTPAGTLVRYYPSGKKYEEADFANLRKGELQGRQTRWFETGQVQATEEYAAGKRQGLLTTFYPNGVVRRREEFVQGKSRAAQCFTAAGQPVACSDYVVFPEYPGGLQLLLTRIQTSVNYPEQQIQEGIEGKVRVDFVIDKTGAVRNARIQKSLSEPLDAEALRVVNSLPDWTPGRLDGEPVEVLFTLPVTFKIE